MAENVHADNTLRKNKENFQIELKMYINENLFRKNLISEEMYWTAKELLMKQAS